MDELDRKIRKTLLKPLVRRPNRADRPAYLAALDRLEDRALGEHLLAKLRSVLELDRKSRKKGDWKNPDRARKYVSLAKALYAARKISQDEYVFYAASPIEDVHEGRLMDGLYKERFESIDKAMEKVRAEYGLEPDQYWLVSDTPKQYAELEEQWMRIHDATFLETLMEFGLDDLAELKSKSPDEFSRLRERSRRSVFHKDEFAPAIRDVVVRYEREARHAASVEAFSVAVTALGAGAEGLLLLRCLRSPHKATRIAKALPNRSRPRFPNDISTWTFETLIEVCLTAGWLPNVETSMARFDSAGLAHLLRRMRNHVHPGRSAKERPWSTTSKKEYLDADAIYVILLSLLGKVSKRRTTDTHNGPPGQARR